MAYEIKDKEGKLIKYQGSSVYGADLTNALVKDVDLGNRTLLLIGTDETRDRDGDILTYSGWNTENYYKNPVFLWAHDYSSVPIGRTLKIIKRPKQKRLDFSIKFPSAGINPFADMILAEYYEKIINASSVGFIGKKYEEIKEGGEAYFSNRKWTDKELLELSGCPVPCNPSAVQDLSLEKFLENAVFDGIKAKDLFEEYKKGHIPNLKLDDLLEELHVSEIKIIEKGKPKVYNAGIPEPDEGYKTFVIEEPEDEQELDKSVGGARNLTLADEDVSWDSTAAIARIRRFCSSDNSGAKDTINWVQYRKAFGWYDSGDMENFGSYKLPYADVIGGSMKTDQGEQKGLTEIKPIEIDKLTKEQLIDLCKLQKGEIDALKHEINQKAGAVLNRKNLGLLTGAIENIQAVLDSAKKEEEEEDKFKEPDKQEDNSGKDLTPNVKNEKPLFYDDLFKDITPNKPIAKSSKYNSQSLSELVKGLRELNSLMKS